MGAPLLEVSTRTQSLSLTDFKGSSKLTTNSNTGSSISAEMPEEIDDNEDILQEDESSEDDDINEMEEDDDD